MNRFRLSHPLLLTALLFAVLPLLTRPVGINVASEIAILALYAVAFNLLLGYTGVVSFGHSLFFGLGAYGVGLIQQHWFASSAIAIILAVGVAAFAALLVGLLIIKRRGVYFALLTLAFTQMMFTIVFRWTDLTGGETGLQGIARHAVLAFDISTADSFYVFAALVSFCGIAAVWGLIHTPFGRALQGIRENEKRVRLLGCNTSSYKLIALVISAALSGLAGALQALLFHSAYAQVFDWRSAGLVLMMTVLGGTGYFLGPVLGTLIYVFLQYYLSSITSHWMIFLGLIFVVSILFLPNGVASIYDVLRKRAAGGRVQVPGSALGPEPGHAAAAPQAATLEIAGVSKQFGGIVVADGISLDVPRGELFSILGPNGAGKTTFFNMVSGVLPMDDGRIRLAGEPIEHLSDFQRARRGLARSFQIVSVFKGLSVFENVRLAAQLHADHTPRLWGDAWKLAQVNERTWQILRRLRLEDRAVETAGQLSHGDQRLVELGITLACEPSVLLLDEPLAGLAETERTLVAGLIRELAPERTVVLVEHDVDRVLAISDHIAVLHRGHLIASGSPAEISAHPEVREVYLGGDTEGLARCRAAAPAAPGEEILAVRGLTASYDKSQVLHGIDLSIHRGEIVGLLGRNGVGKTTTVMSIAGAIAAHEGTVQFLGKDVTRLLPDAINRRGLGVVPQGRRIFPNLTVAENLSVASLPGRAGRWTPEKVFEIFPRLGERRDSKGRFLSGGEQQLLAIARALMGSLELLILDEPMEGLSPPMVALVADAIDRLRDEAMSILLVEQAANVALQLVDRVYVLNNGQVVHHGLAGELLADKVLAQSLLGIQIQ